METIVRVCNRDTGTCAPVYLVAEVSANHKQDIDKAVSIIEAAAKAGADAVKLQTYTPDTMTLDCSNEYFQIKGTIWEGRNLYDLYNEAYTPWEWHPKLKKVTESLGLDFFSTPFDHTAVDFLEELDVPCYKIASFEVIDIPLLKRIAETRKPVIMSTGMATLGEIEEAVRTLRDNGATDLILLKCVSSYPADPSDMNLRTIPHLSQAFNVPVGISDHTLSLAVPITAVALGACVIEKHFTLSRADGGPDAAFSLEPEEFKAMAQEVRTAHEALGSVYYGLSGREEESRVFRRSLFVSKDIAEGEEFTEENVRSIRPGHGLHTRHLDDILGQRAAVKIEKGAPLSWRLISGDKDYSEG